MENNSKINIDGSFVMAKEFESIWIKKNVNNDYHALSVLNDDDYIDYHMWNDINTKLLYEKYLKNTLVIIGDNPNIIFHGGCLGCKSQRLHGIDRCKGCLYFRGHTNVNLSIDGEECSKFTIEDMIKILRHRKQ